MIHSNLFFGFEMYLEKIVIMDACCDIVADNQRAVVLLSFLNIKMYKA